MPRHSKFWTYIIASPSGTLYTGMTNNLDRRVFEHKNHSFEGFSAKYNCTRLVWFAEFSDVRSAIDLEKKIKGWTRSKKIALIEQENPRWADLAESWGCKMLAPNESLSEQVKKRDVAQVRIIAGILRCAQDDNLGSAATRL